MKTYTIQIRRNSDGRVIEIPWEYDYPEDVLVFSWKEHNFRCDCNREPIFLEAIGLEEPDDSECGRTAYSARILDGDREVYEDFSDLHP